MKVTLYTKAGCPLCEEAHAVLRDIGGETALELDTVDIEADPALRAAYREKVPVVAVEGRAILWGRIDRGVLRRRILRAACRVGRALAPGILLVLAGAWAALPARAGEAYKWVDRTGVVHFTDDLSQVPAAYRRATEAIEMTGRPLLEGSGPSREEAAPEEEPTAPPEETDKYGCNRACWRMKVKSWKDRRERLETKKKDLESAILTTNAMTQPSRLRRLRQELEEAEGGLKEAQKMLDVDLPEEARQAGAPPGWLRDVP